MNTLRDITQRIGVSWLKKLRDAAPDKAAFEAETERIVARVLYEYRNSLQFLRPQTSKTA